LHALRDEVDVPWHRVVNAAGRISVGGASAITQRLRLHAEGVEFAASGRIELKRFVWAAGTKRQRATGRSAR